jgi:hypothetical protein
MNIIHLLRKHLEIFFRDRGSIFYLFILPIVFILVFTGLVGATVSEQKGSGSTTEENAVMLTVVNFDPKVSCGDLVRLFDFTRIPIRQTSEQKPSAAR